MRKVTRFASKLAYKMGLFRNYRRPPFFSPLLGEAFFDRPDVERSTLPAHAEALIVCPNLQSQYLHAPCEHNFCLAAADAGRYNVRVPTYLGLRIVSTCNIFKKSLVIWRYRGMEARGDYVHA